MEGPEDADIPQSAESGEPGPPQLSPADVGSSDPGTCSTLSQASLDRQMPCVGHRLYISGFGGVTNQAVLRQRGITHIVNMARELIDVFPQTEGIVVRHYSLRDSEQEDLGRHLPELVDYIHHVIEGGGLVAVNCVAGVSRSASVVLAYRVRYEQRSLRQAFEELKQARRVVSPNLAFWRALADWEQTVRGHSSVLFLPYVCGQVPDVGSYRRHTELCIKLAFMRDLLITWAVWTLILTLQIVAIVWF